jgi:hypothetical protein
VIVRLGPRGRSLLLRSRHRALALQVIVAAPPAKARKVAATLVAAR